jgi:hypothetical protein
MDIAGRARKLERKLARTVDAAIGELVGRDEPAPLEIVHAVLDRAEHEVQELGSGRRVFPYNAVRLSVAAPARDRQARARLEAVLAGPPSLVERLVDRLRRAGCADVRLALQLVFVRQQGTDWEDPRFHVTFERVAEPTSRTEPATPTAARTTAPRLRLTVVKGSTDQKAYAFAGGRIDIGRRSEVIDQRQRLVRTNQIAFVDDDTPDNRSVSRRHAHIEYVES